MKLKTQLVISGVALFLIGISLDFIFNLVAAEIKVQVWYDENRIWILALGGLFGLVGIILTAISMVGGEKTNTKMYGKMNDTTIATEDEQFLREQLTHHQENRRQLLKQKSIYAAGEEPLHLLNQIAAEEKAIKEIERQFRK